MTPLRYLAAACQTDLPLPRSRAQMRRNTDRILLLADHAVAAYAPLVPLRLIVFPEFAHSGPAYKTARELRKKIALPIPNEHTDLLERKAREYGLYIQSGTMLESDDRWPDAVFNTTCLIGPQGILLKYRKLYPWLPWEVHTSPHDLADYPDEMFPVARTEIGNLAVAVCYDWLFPETLRQLTANGAEVLLRVSAYMDPWGATEPMDWWTVVNRCRALENLAYVVAANQAASLKHFPPFSWPGGSMIVDYEGRVLAQASPGAGEQTVVATIDLDALRHERAARRTHQMLAQLRTEIYSLYRQPLFPAGTAPRGEITFERSERLTELAKQKLGYILEGVEARSLREFQNEPSAATPRSSRSGFKRRHSQVEKPSRR